MQDSKLPVGRNLALDGYASRDRSVPILLFFSQDHCPFFDRLEEEVLRPMVISGDYEELVILRKLSIDYGEEVIGFDGKVVSNREIFHDYDGFVTPTLVVIDGSGELLAEPLLGINTVEYFGWYLDSAIDTGIDRLRKPSK